MTRFYTSIEQQHGNILLRGVEDNKRVIKKIKYQPSLFVRATKETKYKTIFGESLEKISFSDISEARKFIEKYRNTTNFKIYGNTNFIYSFIADEFAEQVEYDINKILIAYIDIEVGSEKGFPQPEDANEEIQAITILINRNYFTFGCGDFQIPEDHHNQK